MARRCLIIALVVGQLWTDVLHDRHVMYVPKDDEYTPCDHPDQLTDLLWVLCALKNNW
jgi:hypothetical protein